MHHKINRQLGDALAEGVRNILTRVKPIVRLHDDKCRVHHPRRITTEERTLAALYVDLYDEELSPRLHRADLGDAVDLEMTLPLYHTKSVRVGIWIGDAQPRRLVPDRPGKRCDPAPPGVASKHRQIFAIGLDGIDIC